ncbi:MAG: HPP family protein [Planctomycetota bacterium]
MKRTLSEMAREFRRHWKNYVLQSALATLILLLALVVLRLQQIVIAASIGSTAFIVFAMPGGLTAKARNVVGGHLVGGISGAVCGALAGLAVVVGSGRACSRSPTACCGRTCAISPDHIPVASPSAMRQPARYCGMSSFSSVV